MGSRRSNETGQAGPWQILGLGVWLMSLVLLTGCSDSMPTYRKEPSGAPKKILTTFTILQDLAQNVAGTNAVVESITKPGAEIHDYEPTPLDLVKAQSADLILWNGMGLEHWFERFFETLENVPRAVLSEGIQPMGISEGTYRGKPNPHCWMSPANALVYVENLRVALTRLDPSGAAQYATNAARYSAQLRSVDQVLRTELAKLPPQQRWLVTSEGAFSYLARDYGLRELFLWPVNADEEGTPRQIRRVVDRIRENRIPVVFSESTISDKPMRQVARETKAHFGGLLNVDSLTPPEGEAPTYLKLLESNAKRIIDGFSSNDRLTHVP